MSRHAIALAVTLAVAATLAAVSGAGNAETTAFLCPKNPAASPATLWVKNYGPKFRGSTWCNDGANAT